MTVPTVLLVLLLIVAVMVPWTLGFNWLWNRFADPWLRRRFQLPPKEKSDV